ncbi:MAG: ZIP family metal transporter [Atopobiaceae bacterium]|nr:ZIP family metal transporter [Atopobiaceae bacterium]
MSPELLEVLRGVLTPFLGTSLGACCALFLKNQLSDKVVRALNGFGAGVMVAASIWSLIIPAIDQSAAMDKLAFIPAVVGFWVGVLFLMLLDIVVPQLHIISQRLEGHGRLPKTIMMVLAVTLHNIPEGMAVGVLYAGWLSGKSGITAMGAFILALGIASQNFPEGAIISMPLRAEGMSRTKAVLMGIASGVVEPIASFFTIVASEMVIPILPYLLGFAAGAMMFVVVDELVPEMDPDDNSKLGVIAFTLGFTLMMSLDVALG